MTGRPTLVTALPRRFFIATASALALLVGCSQRESPKCFGENPGENLHTAVEETALADARRREGPCENKTTQCGFYASTLSSGEIMIRVEHASPDEASKNCMTVVDSDHHFLYSSQGKFEEAVSSPKCNGLESVS